MIKKLKNYCDKIGNSFDLFQASGGNISVKTKKYIYIKSSGTSIIDKKFSKLPLLDSKKKIFKSISNNCKKKLVYQFGKPSMEVSFHVLLKKKIIFHAHYIDLISWTVDIEKRSELIDIIKKNKFEFIPYVSPGIKLAKKINPLQKNSNQIFILENHGVIITGDTFDEIDSQLNKLKKIFKINNKKKINYFNFKSIYEYSRNYNFKLPSSKLIHNLAFNKNIKFFEKDIMFPDQIVFVKDYYIFKNVLDFRKNFKNKTKYEDIKIIIIKNLGVFFYGSILKKKYLNEMLLCLYLITTKISNLRNIKKLKKIDINEIRYSEEEKYRQNLEI